MSPVSVSTALLKIRSDAKNCNSAPQSDPIHVAMSMRFPDNNVVGVVIPSDTFVPVRLNDPLSSFPELSILAANVNVASNCARRFEPDDKGDCHSWNGSGPPLAPKSSIGAL